MTPEKRAFYARRRAKREQERRKERLITAFGYVLAWLVTVAFTAFYIYTDIHRRDTVEVRQP